MDRLNFRIYKKHMKMEFDSKKDAANIAKHGISLTRLRDLEAFCYVEDNRFSEPRFRLYGYIDGLLYCMAGMHREGRIRVINLRRAHKKEAERVQR